jgi:hypothetical protein
MTVGPGDPNAKVLAFDAVPGSGIQTLSEAVPQAELIHGQAYVYLITWQDGSSFTGVCEARYRLQVVDGRYVRLIGKAKIRIGMASASLSAHPE